MSWDSLVFRMFADVARDEVWWIGGCGLFQGTGRCGVWMVNDLNLFGWFLCLWLSLHPLNIHGMFLFHLLINSLKWERSGWFGDVMLMSHWHGLNHTWSWFELPGYTLLTTYALTLCHDINHALNVSIAAILCDIATWHTCMCMHNKLLISRFLFSWMDHLYINTTKK